MLVMQMHCRSNIEFFVNDEEMDFNFLFSGRWKLIFVFSIKGRDDGCQRPLNRVEWAWTQVGCRLGQTGKNFQHYQWKEGGWPLPHEDNSTKGV